jgi:hypothetical protein
MFSNCVALKKLPPLERNHRGKLLNGNLQNRPSSRTLISPFTIPIRGRAMVRFFEIAAPVLIVAYAATYMAMRYLFPPEVRR